MLHLGTMDIKLGLILRCAPKRMFEELSWNVTDLQLKLVKADGHQSPAIPRPFDTKQTRAYRSQAIAWPLDTKPSGNS